MVDGVVSLLYKQLMVNLYGRRADAGREVGQQEHWEGAQANTGDNWPYLAGKYFILNISREI